MEEKDKELKKKINDIKGLIKSNSKDVHYAETLLAELSSLIKEYKHEPTLVHIPMEEVEKSYKGDTWEMCYTKRGEAVYRTYGGYTLICSSLFNALNSTIQNSIDYLNGDIKEELTDEQKQVINDDILSTQWVLNLPLHACSDLDFKYDLTNKFVEFIQKQVEKSTPEEPQEETIEQDREFKEAMIGMENAREIIGGEVEKLKDK